MALVTKNIAKILLQMAWESGMDFRGYWIGGGYLLLTGEAGKADWHRLFKEGVVRWRQMRIDGKEDIYLPRGIPPGGD